MGLAGDALEALAGIGHRDQPFGRCEPFAISLGELAQAYHRLVQALGIEVLQRAVLEWRETPAEDGADVGVPDRLEHAFLQAANSLVGLG